MWEGKVTEELKLLFLEYYERFDGYPDEYVDIDYYAINYDEFVGYIKECLKRNLEIPYVVE